MTHIFETWAHQYIPTAGYGQWGGGAARYAPPVMETGMPSVPGWRGIERVMNGQGGQGSQGGNDWRDIYMPMMWEIEHLANSSAPLHSMMRIVVSHTMHGGVSFRLVTNTARDDPALEENQTARNAAAKMAARSIELGAPTQQELNASQRGLDEEDRAGAGAGAGARSGAAKSLKRGPGEGGGDGPSRHTQFTTPWFEREVVEAHILPAVRDAAEHMLKYGLYVVVYGEVSLTRDGTKLVIPRIAQPHEYIIKRRYAPSPVKRGLHRQYKAVFPRQPRVHSRVFVIHEPDAMGIVTSPVRRVMQPLRLLHSMLDNLAIADHDRARPSVIQNPLPPQKGSMAETDGTTTMGRVIEARVNYSENTAAEVRLAHTRAGEQLYEDAKRAFAEKRRMDMASAHAGARGMQPVGNALADGGLGPGGSNVQPRVGPENLLMAPPGFQWQMAPSAHTDAGWDQRVRELITMVGRAIGVSSEWIHPSSSQHAAGAHMARWQLTAMVAEIQQELRPQIIEWWYDMYGDSLDVYRVQRRALLRRRYGVSAVDWDDAPAVVLQFNSLPQMTPDIMKDLLATGVISWDTFSAMALRFNNLPSRDDAGTPSKIELERVMAYVRGEKPDTESAGEKTNEKGERKV